MNKQQLSMENVMVCKECLAHTAYDNTGVCKNCMDKALQELLELDPSILDPEFGEEPIKLPIEEDILDILDREKRCNGYAVEGLSRKGYWDEEGNYHSGGYHE